jgi:hypothetical protein
VPYIYVSANTDNFTMERVKRVVLTGLLQNL